MNKLIKQLGVGENFSIKTTIAVEELLEHDMIYVYHHLQVGSTVSIKQFGTNVKGDPRYEVYFGNFKLGLVTITGIMRSFYEGQTSGEAEIVAFEKEKFMPIKALDVQIGVQAMRKVG